MGTSPPKSGMPEAERAYLDDRVDVGDGSLREHTARGTLINSAFQVGLALLGLLQRVVLAAFLTRDEFGIWGIVLTTLMTLAWLKELGVADKYIQQNEPDQEEAYQKAFTIEFLLSLAFFLMICAALPIYALIYGRTEIILPGLVLGASVPISAFETPTWITYRRMQFVKQRTLSSIDPVTALICTIVLGILGAGYWSLVLGVVAGSVVGGIVCTATSPYPVRLRFSRKTLKEYASFSWPLVGYQLSNLVVVQGLVVVSARSVGVAGVGAITMANSISGFAERVDTIVSETIYPAVCAVADRTELLLEAFVKSNRLALMWGMPFGVGLALFAGPLVHHVFGARWEPAIGLLAAFGVIAGIGQVAFNWQIFMRAVDDTKPIFLASLVNVATFFVITVPLVIAFGLIGFAVAMIAVTGIQVIMRGVFLRRLFAGFQMWPHFVRAVAPSIPAAGCVLAPRLLVHVGTGTAARAVVELGLYIAVTVGSTWLFEREFVREILGYVRGRGGGIRSRSQAVDQVAEPSVARS